MSIQTNFTRVKVYIVNTKQTKKKLKKYLKSENEKTYREKVWFRKKKKLL